MKLLHRWRSAPTSSKTAVPTSAANCTSSPRKNVSTSSDNDSVPSSSQVFDVSSRKKSISFDSAVSLRNCARKCDRLALREYTLFRSRNSIWVSAVSVPLFGFFLYLLLHYLLFFDLNKRVYNHVPGECTYLPGSDRGVADFHLINNQTLIASAGTDLNNATNATGAGILLWHINAYESKLLELKRTRKEDRLNPYGLSFAMNTIMVVNLRRPVENTDTVELLRIDNEMLKRVRKPVKSPMFTSLCDIHALSSQRFLVTNSHRFRHASLQVAETTLKLNTASIFYFDGKRVRRALSGLPASTCSLAMQSHLLYVSIMSADQIRVYKMGKTPQDWTLREVIPVYSAPHFFQLGPTPGNLVVATHANKLKHLLQRYWPYEYFAPSQVLRFRRTRKGKWHITQYYANDGATISGASVAVQLLGRRLAIGSVKNGLLKCALTSV